jgi:nucleotide-binding universal stress UspA family protein
MALKSILVAYDGTLPARAALGEAVDIVEVTHARLTLICVIPVMAGAFGIEMPPGESVVATIEGARSMLAAEKVALEKKGVSGVDTVLLEGDPVDRVLEYAAQHTPDLIVVGSRGLSEAGRFFLGSVSDGILHHARCSVLVSKSVVRPVSPRASHAM